MAGALAAATAAALLLAACGGSGGSGDKASSDTIPGVPTATSAPAPSGGSTAPGVQRPVITIPAGFTMAFDNWTPGDPVQSAILNDGRERLRSIHSAVLASDPGAASIAFYDTGNALLTDKTWVQGFKTNGLTITGSGRFYKPRVKVPKSDTATLSFCADESKGFAKNLGTGKIDRNAPTKNSYVLYNTKLQKNAQGVWQTTVAVTLRGACPIDPRGNVGTAYPAGAAGDPSCGVTYRRMTNGTPYPLKVSITWKISWSGSDGTINKPFPAGTFFKTTDVTVRELQAVNRSTNPTG
ncbi:hypothetical protein QMK19_33585 [Streptomyces sp. H10-C2]|uniref:hypothetical protein n=1 Tax=unclassified Streptomyces TaxID=2593676 RepID=UPI0024BB5D20|nr:MULTISPECIES: hypothetical protein [unclassified Streptomyces]MDJ0347080.1 hypothetical protein [Streptomyces sp. PH10-H1]MDJ0374426.1 hypothetical protein [Streptomyces sp. H10-C2]